MALASASEPTRIIDASAPVFGAKSQADTVSTGSCPFQVEAPVTVEEGDKKYSATSVRYIVVDGKYRIKGIQLSGTKTTLIFNN